MKYLFFPTLFVVFALLMSCDGDTAEIEALYEKEDVAREIISEVKITYSDSAKVRLMVTSPLMIRSEIDNKMIEEFPDGLFVEFFHNSFNPQSWLKAEKGIRYPDDKKIILRGNVQLYNEKNDKLESSELIWNEETQEISTEKFVRITQPERGDTTYGFGFISDQQFKRFEIKRKFSGKIEEEMLKELGD